jgi:hypothetical protein
LLAADAISNADSIHFVVVEAPRNLRGIHDPHPLTNIGEHPRQFGAYLNGLDFLVAEEVRHDGMSLRFLRGLDGRHLEGTRKLIAELPASIVALNFKDGTYIDRNGHQRPMIEFSEDVLPSVIGRHGPGVTTSLVSDHLATRIAWRKFSQ